MNPYIFIDILFFVLLISLIIYSYKIKIYEKLFDYFKIFLFLTLSAKLAPFTGELLQKLYITKVDTYTTLLLISFALNYVIFHNFFKYFLVFSNKIINNQKVKNYASIVLTIVEVTLVLTFTIYILMQIYFIKAYIHPTLIKSYSYPKIEKFYKTFLNDKVVHTILNMDTSTNSKELIFKNLKNSL